MGALGSCTMDELEGNTIQIDIEKLEISEFKNSEEPQDTTSDRNGGSKPPVD